MSTVTLLKDDVDGTLGEDVKTHPFKIGGVEYEIDLTDRNMSALLETIKPWLDFARVIRAAPVKKAPSASNGALSEIENTALRNWATNTGVSLPARGRIPTAIIAQFRATVDQIFPPKAG